MTTMQAQPSAADFLARNRGGGLFTMTVSQRIGAYMSVAAHRLGLAPTILTIGYLVIGLGTSIAVLTPAFVSASTANRVSRRGRYSANALIVELANAPTPLATSTWKDEEKLSIPPVWWR